MAKNLRFSLPIGPRVHPVIVDSTLSTLTPGQKAAATKRANGLDLSAVAQKAVATRNENLAAAAMLAAKIRRSEIAKRAAATRAARKAA
jgi:hypothetical protein